jgi:hypothetical protein
MVRPPQRSGLYASYGGGSVSIAARVGAVRRCLAPRESRLRSAIPLSLRPAEGAFNYVLRARSIIQLVAFKPCVISKATEWPCAACRAMLGSASGRSSRPVLAAQATRRVAVVQLLAHGRPAKRGDQFAALFGTGPPALAWCRCVRSTSCGARSSRGPTDRSRPRSLPPGQDSDLPAPRRC